MKSLPVSLFIALWVFVICLIWGVGGLLATQIAYYFRDFLKLEPDVHLSWYDVAFKMVKWGWISFILVIGMIVLACFQRFVSLFKHSKGS